MTGPKVLQELTRNVSEMALLYSYSLETAFQVL